MELPDAIAINIALLENVFTLLVCVVNKIPLFDVHQIFLVDFCKIICMEKIQRTVIFT